VQTGGQRRRTATKTALLVACYKLHTPKKHSRSKNIAHKFHKPAQTETKQPVETTLKVHNIRIKHQIRLEEKNFLLTIAAPQKQVDTHQNHNKTNVDKCEKMRKTACQKLPLQKQEIATEAPRKNKPRAADRGIASRNRSP